jgi:hypothetical protein
LFVSPSEKRLGKKLKEPGDALEENEAMMSDREFAELELRAMICPQQCEWPKFDAHWQRLHAVPNEARERVSKAYTKMEEIDSNTGLSREEKQHRRSEVEPKLSPSLSHRRR